MSNSGMGRDVHLFDVVHPAFPLLTTTLTSLKSALTDGFGEAVVAYDIAEQCQFLSLDRCQKCFLWKHKEVDLALHPVVGLVLQVGDREKPPYFLMCLGRKAWILSSESASRVHVSQP